MILITDLGRVISRNQPRFPLACESSDSDSGVFTCSTTVQINTAIPAGEYPLVVVARDEAGHVSNRWPFFSILRRAETDEEAELLFEEDLEEDLEDDELTDVDGDDESDVDEDDESDVDEDDATDDDDNSDSSCNSGSGSS